MTTQPPATAAAAGSAASMPPHAGSAKPQRQPQRQNRQESHRVYLQQFSPHAQLSNPAPSPFAPTSAVGGDGGDVEGDRNRGGVGSIGANVVTSSAAIRLTDAARASDVTDLLRKKFGFPTSTPSPRRALSGGLLSTTLSGGKAGPRGGISAGGGGAAAAAVGESPLDRINRRLDQVRGNAPPPVVAVPSRHRRPTSAKRTGSKGEGGEGGGGGGGISDALVLVGTLHALPLHYVRFEHEAGAEAFPSADAPGADGTADEVGGISATAVDGGTAKSGSAAPLPPPPVPTPPPPPTRQRIPTSASAQTVQAAGGRARPVSSSSLSSAAADDLADFPPEATIGLPSPATTPRPIAAMAVPSLPPYETSWEPLHVVRTLRPTENPLSVRDEVLSRLVELRRSAEIEMGVLGRPNRKLGTGRKAAAPTVRWYFVPAAADGKAMSVPGCVEVDGYCTGMDDDDDDDEEKKEADDGDRDAAEEKSNEADEDGPADRRPSTRAAAARRRRGEEFRYEYSRAPPPDDGLRRPSHSGPSSASPSRDFDFLGDVDVVVDAAPPPGGLHKPSRLQDERHRLSVLSRYESAVENQCVSGYLLKRSSRDPNVWRRVHCVLTDGVLWYVSRMRDLGTDRDYRRGNDDAVDAVNASTKPRRRVGVHGCIRLTRSLLMEPTSLSQSSSPSRDGGGGGGTRSSSSASSLSRVPNSFELATSEGTTHAFRARTKGMQSAWVKALSDRIVRCHEDSYMELAELIVSEEADARNRRVEALTVAPFLSSAAPEEGGGGDGRGLARGGAAAVDAARGGTIQPFSLSGTGAEIVDVVRWSFDVSDYKEACRHAEERMPKRHAAPVVVVAPSAPTSSSAGPSPLRRRRRPRFGGARGEAKAADGGKSGAAAAADGASEEDVRESVRSAWETARTVLAKSERVVAALSSCPSSSSSSNSSSSSSSLSSSSSSSASGPPPSSQERDVAEASGGASFERDVRRLRGDVERVLDARSHRGERRTADAADRSEIAGADAVGGEGPDDVGGAPPPMDLFDPLLGKLQERAIEAERGHRESGLFGY